MLLNLCEFVEEELLPSERAGDREFCHVEVAMKKFRLYERFLFAYYQREHRYLTVSNPKFCWNSISGDVKNFPEMKTDVVLEWNGRMCIVDAKFYQDEVCVAADFYQIFAYVKNIPRSASHRVAGMLLYAKPEHKSKPGEHHLIDGHRIGFDLLDMGAEWSVIKAQLDAVPRVYLEMDVAEGSVAASHA